MIGIIINIFKNKKKIVGQNSTLAVKLLNVFSVSDLKPGLRKAQLGHRGIFPKEPRVRGHHLPRTHLFHSMPSPCWALWPH